MLLQSGAVKIKVLLTPFISQTEKRLKVCNVSDSDQPKVMYYMHQVSKTLQTLSSGHFFLMFEDFRAVGNMFSLFLDSTVYVDVG